MNRTYAVLALLAATLLAGCYYDVEEDLYPTLECNTQGVTFSTTIQPILQDNCLSCHSNSLSSGNINLEGYSNLKIYVDNGRFLGAIKREAGFSPMPQNQPQLVECNIAKIEAWINAGAPNN